MLPPAATGRRPRELPRRLRLINASAGPQGYIAAVRERLGPTGGGGGRRRRLGPIDPQLRFGLHALSNQTGGNMAVTEVAPASSGGGAYDEGLKRDVGLLGLMWASEGSIIGSGWLFGALAALELAGPSALLGWVLASF